MLTRKKKRTNKQINTQITNTSHHAPLRHTRTTATGTHTQKVQDNGTQTATKGV